MTPEPTPTRRFRALPFVEVQWTGTNKAEIDALYGAGWERHLIDGGHPLLVGHWLLRLADDPAIYVMSSRVRADFTEPVGGSDV